MVNFGPLTVVWGAPANFNGFRFLASLLQRHRSSEANQPLHDVWPSPWAGALHRQSGHHVGHRPTFLVPNVTQVCIESIIYDVFLCSVCFSSLFGEFVCFVDTMCANDFKESCRPTFARRDSRVSVEKYGN